MKARQIFEVYAKIIDSTGAYNTLSGYPKVFDSRSYDDDIDKALLRATGAYYTCLGTMCSNDTRQLQMAILMSADGTVLEHKCFGEIADVDVEG